MLPLKRKSADEPDPNKVGNLCARLDHDRQSQFSVVSGLRFEPAACLGSVCLIRKGIVTLTGAPYSLASSGPSSGRHARALPSFERYGSKLFVHGPFEEMTLVVESVVGRRMDVEEALRRAG